MASNSVYLFLGPEIGEKQDAIDEIRVKLAGSNPANLEQTSYYAGETAVSGMVSAILNGSLFADTRLFFIKNAEVIKKKEEIELLGSWIAKPQPGVTVIFISEETSVDKKLEKILPPQAKRVFWELSGSRKAEWTVNFFKREGFRITTGGVDTILELVENNTDALRRECSRLMLFLGKDTVIDGETAEKWMAHTREESAFTLFSRIAGGDLAKSLESLRTLLAAKTAPPMIIAGLASAFRRYRDFLDLWEAGNGNPDRFELKKIGISAPQAIKDYTEAARRHVPADDCLSLIAEYDVLTRSGGGALESMLMDTLIYKLVTALPSARAADFSA